NAQTRGSGLGLTIVDRVARAHGGSIAVAKGRTRGAEFTLRLPAAEAP
ncbi:MAG TPA: ATP-binding protein, partial [Thermoanaerobaculia bacterium]|nr:ATP-binding protein [Thermoanaerobaculia bacterium]